MNPHTYVQKEASASSTGKQPFLKSVLNANIPSAIALAFVLFAAGSISAGILAKSTETENTTASAVKTKSLTTRVLGETTATTCPYAGPANGAPPQPGCSSYQQSKINDDANNCWVPKFEQAIKDLGYTPYRIAQYVPPSYGSCGYTFYNIGFQGLTVLNGTVGGNLEALLNGYPESPTGANLDPIVLAKRLLDNYSFSWNQFGGEIPLEIHQKMEAAAEASGYVPYAISHNPSPEFAAKHPNLVAPGFGSQWSTYLARVQKQQSARIPLVVLSDADVAAARAATPPTLCPPTIPTYPFDLKNNTNPTALNLTLNFINLSCTTADNNTGNKWFNVGDKYRLAITGAPGMEITMQGGLGGGDGSTKVMGKIPASGLWVADATLTNNEIGQWAEVWRVGGAPSLKSEPYGLAFLQYQVAAAGTSNPQYLYPSTYSSAALKAVNVTLENLTTGNNKIFHVGDKYRIKVTSPDGAANGASVVVQGGDLGDGRGPLADIYKSLPRSAGHGYPFRVGSVREEALPDDPCKIKTTDIGNWSQTWIVGAGIFSENQNYPGNVTYITGGYPVAHFDFQVLPATNAVTNPDKDGKVTVSLPAPQTARYVKFLRPISVSQPELGPAWTGLREIEIFDSTGAKIPVATSSVSNYLEGPGLDTRIPSMAYDGDLKTSWNNGPGEGKTSDGMTFNYGYGTYPNGATWTNLQPFNSQTSFYTYLNAWIQFDLGSPKIISRIKLWGWDIANQYPLIDQLLVSSDGTTFTKIFEFQYSDKVNHFGQPGLGDALRDTVGCLNWPDGLQQVSGSCNTGTVSATNAAVPAYSSQTLTSSSNKSLKLSVTPIKFENQEWTYKLDWSRTLNRQGSVYVTLKSNKSTKLLEAATASRTGSEQLTLAANTAYRVEFYSQPNGKGTLLLRKYFTTLGEP